MGRGLEEAVKEFRKKGVDASPKLVESLLDLAEAMDQDLVVDTAEDPAKGDPHKIVTGIRVITGEGGARVAAQMDLVTVKLLAAKKPAKKGKRK